MKNSGVLLKALVISGLMVINGPSAVLCDSRQSSENCGHLILCQPDKEKSFLAASIECVPGTWTGATSTVWNNAANWCDNVIPTSTTNVTIPLVGNQPVIGSAAMCYDLTIQSGAKLTISGSNVLTVSGNFVNNGNFTRNQSTVIFNGKDQEVGKCSYYNLILRGTGLKKIHNFTEKDIYTYIGILSMEDRAMVSETPTHGPISCLQYNTIYDMPTGLEWPSTFIDGSVMIKNTGIITLNNSKTLTVNTYRCGLTIEEGATLNLDIYAIWEPETLNLKCGGRIKRSSIIGTGNLYLKSTLVNVTDAEHGTAGAMITCPVILIGASTLTIANDALNIYTDDDLTLSMLSSGGSLYKYGQGTLNLGTSEILLDNFKVYQGHVKIPVGARISVGVETIIDPSKGLTIESNASGTGSFIATSASGSASVIRYMSPSRWHIVSSPVSGQSIIGFLGANENIPKNIAPNAPTGVHVERGMRGYDPSANQWSDFYTDETPGDIEKGKGYLMRVKSTTETQNVTFSGTLNAGEVSVTGLMAGKWNCIGNPYTSAMRINSATATNAFLSINSANLDQSYGAIYIWDQPDASNGNADKYTIVSNASSAYNIQLGQAFMVKMAAGKTFVNLKKIMQVHNTSLDLKTTDGVWPTIKLKAMADSITSSTIIAFHEGMTAGLDPTYDAGLLKAGDEMSLYTILLEDAGIPFAIQALPADYESIIIPLGIDGVNGGKVSFSADLLHVPSTCQAILEDRLYMIFTDLSVSSYTADLNGSNSSQGRFFLHTSHATTTIDYRERIQNFRAWAVSNLEMKINGQVDTKAIVRLYDIQGRLVLSERLNAGLNHTIRLPEIKPGIYILQVHEMQHKQILKLVISE